MLELRLQNHRDNYRMVIFLLGLATAMVAVAHIASKLEVNQTVGFIELAAALCITSLAMISGNWAADRLAEAGAASLVIAASVANISTILREPTLVVGSDGYGPQSVLICGLVFCSVTLQAQVFWTTLMIASVMGLDFAMRGANGVRFESLMLLATSGVIGVFTGRLILDLLNRGQESLEDFFVEARTDLLTGMPNRKYFEEAFTREQHGASRQGVWFAICLIDVDYFKSVNDRFGHAAGDDILVEMAQLFSEIVRKWDLTARWGGEEFILLLHEDDTRAAEAAAERIRIAVENHWFTHSKDQKLRVTVSIGIAMHDGSEDLSSIVERADKALFQSKKSGRNCTTVCGQESVLINWDEF